MKKINMLSWILGLAFVVSLSGCDEHERFSSLPDSVQKAFNNKYPKARFHEWEMKYGYYVLDFRHEGLSAEAWFDRYQWVMTETDLHPKGLPTAVSQALAASVYANWRIEDVDFVERATMEPLYIIEIEKGDREVELSYLANGTLVREDLDLEGENVYLPELPVEILMALNEMYPGSVVLEAELEHGFYEVDILHERKEMEVVFKYDCSWLHTSQEIPVADLSQAVLDFVHQQYDGYTIDDVTLFFTALQGDFYEIELEKGLKEITIKVSFTGELIP